MICEVLFEKGYKTNNYVIDPCFCFVQNDAAMLLNRELGTTMLLDRSLLEEVKGGTLSDNMLYRMVSLGFAKTVDSPAGADPCKRIHPNFFLIDMTNACNLSCAYCLRVPEEDKRNISSEMVEQICEYILKTCSVHHLDSITVQPWGGEPLLQFDKILKIRDFFDRHKEIRVNILVQTNGILLTDENLELMKTHDINFGISVDGPAEIHDGQRVFPNGRKTLQLVEAGVRRAREHGFCDLGGICVITNRSLGKIKSILHYALYDLGLDSIKLNLMHQPTHDCGDIRALTSEEIPSFCREYFEAYLEIKAEKELFSEGNIEDRIRNLLYRSDSNICHSCGCCGGRRMVSFDMDGNIFPCELTDWKEEILGNIYDGRDLYEIISEAAEKNSYFVPKTDPKCEMCPWYYYCKGGCSAAVKYLGEHSGAIDPMECEFNRNIYPLIIEDLLSETEKSIG